MTGSRSCVPADRLTALALAASTPEGGRDQDLLAHVASCAACAQRLTALTRELDELRAAAWQEVDAAFDDSALENQRSRILDRLAHLGQAARVLRFPARSRDAAMPVSPMSRRWLSVAAAAGLLIGLVAGQLIHFVPWDTRLHRSASAAPQLQNATAPRGSSGPMIVQAASTIVAATDEELLDEIDEAMEWRRAATLRALDAFTPRVGDVVEIR
jgi:hypothetical protein